MATLQAYIGPRPHLRLGGLVGRLGGGGAGPRALAAGRLRVGAADEDKEESTDKRKSDQLFHCDAILSIEVLTRSLDVHTSNTIELPR